MNELDESDKTAKDQGPVTDPLVVEANDHINRSYRSQIRDKAMTGIEEDKIIDESLNDALPHPMAFKQIKDTLMMQLKRLVREDNYGLPKANATMAVESDEATRYAAEDIVRRAGVEGNYETTMRHVVNEACFRDGSSFVEILPESYRDYRENKSYEKLKIKKYDPANVFYDPRCKNYFYEGDYIAFRHEYSNAKAELIAKSLYGYEEGITPGDYLNVFDEEQSNENDEDIPPETTVFYVYWNPTKKLKLVYAGGHGQVIQKKEGQTAFPYKNKWGQCDFPVAQYDATPYKYGIHALSYIGVAKDVTRQKAKQFNTILPYFERVNNQILAVTGAMSAEDMANQMSDAMEMQAQGMQGVLSINDPQSRVIPVYPQDITQAFERISVIFDNELAKRLGFALNVQEKQVSGGVPTATQILEQKDVHAKAIANLNKINVDYYTRLNDVTLNYSRVIYRKSTQKATLSLGGEQYETTIGSLIEQIDNYRGGWVIDTSVELQLTRNDKIIMLEALIKRIVEILQVPITSIEESKVIQDLLWAEIRLKGFDEYIQKSELAGYFQAIVERNSQAVEAQQEGELVSEDTGETPAIQQAAADAGAEAPQPVV